MGPGIPSARESNCIRKRRGLGGRSASRSLGVAAIKTSDGSGIRGDNAGAGVWGRTEPLGSGKTLRSGRLDMGKRGGLGTGIGSRDSRAEVAGTRRVVATFVDADTSCASGCGSCAGTSWGHSTITDPFSDRTWGFGALPDCRSNTTLVFPNPSSPTRTRLTQGPSAGKNRCSKPGETLVFFKSIYQRGGEDNSAVL